MNTAQKRSLLIFAVLALVMAGTRFHHFGSVHSLPDASLAVFFLGGIYLAGKIAFPLLLAEAGLIDYLAITAGGVSDWCVTPAYGFLVPTYAVMWLAGRFVSPRASDHIALRWQSLLPTVGALFVASSIAFLISNGAFYALSGYFPELSWTQYAGRVAKYYPSYVSDAFYYVAFAAFVHWAVASVGALRASRAGY